MAAGFTFGSKCAGLNGPDREETNGQFPPRNLVRHVDLKQQHELTGIHRALQPPPARVRKAFLERGDLADEK